MTVKNTIRSLLSQSPLYLRLRYSGPVLRLWLFLRPEVGKALRLQRSYYDHLLRWLHPVGSAVVFDIGANEGWVSGVLLQKGVSVVALEPDRRNIAILRARFGNGDRFRLYPFAAGAGDGVLPFYREAGGGALSTLNPRWKGMVEGGSYRLRADYEAAPVDVPVMSLDALMRETGKPVFAKIDVEGYEAEVVKGLSHRIPLITFEAILPAFREETLGILSHLHAIDPGVLFTFSSIFVYGTDTFLAYDAFRERLMTIGDACVDILCVMSNYSDHYSRLPDLSRSYLK